MQLDVHGKAKLDQLEQTHAILEARLPHLMVEQSLARFAPLKIHLAEPSENRRWIELDPPTAVEFCPGQGIRIVTSGRFRFDIAGLPIAAHLDRIEVMASPKIVQVNGADAASIPIEILDADVRLVPGLVDDLIVGQVNRALTPRASQLVWRLAETLSASFPMPERLEQVEKLKLDCESSRFDVTTDSVHLRVAYRLGVLRTDDSASPEQRQKELPRRTAGSRPAQ